MRPFKFLQDNKNEDIVVSEGASWIYGRLENLNQYQYNILTENHYGIHSFLNQFPSWFVVTIISITGPDGLFVHDIDNQGIGWGFDITSDLITIEWVRFIN